MNLTVLNVGYSMAKVGPNSVGGAEQVLAQIDRALVHRGHQSLVVALKGSSVSGVLLATPKVGGPLDRAEGRPEYKNHRLAIEAALSKWRIDLIHMHGIDFHEYLPHQTAAPILVTLHLPPSWYPPEIFTNRPDNLHYNCVSATQQSVVPPGTRLLPFIENGVNASDFPPFYRKRNYVAALGRICPEKGFHLAIDAAKRAGYPMLLAGEVYRYLEHENYFKREITPRLDASRRFIGPIGLMKKRRMLAAARCLLVPSLAAETSSLVAMEALASGTPVVAFPAGALPEIIEHGRTGFIVNDTREMAEAIQKTHLLNPEECRNAAQKRFSLDHTVNRYLDLYRQLTERESLSQFQ